MGSLPRGRHITTFRLSIPALSPPCSERIMPPPPRVVRGVCFVSVFPRVAWVPSGVVSGGWRRVMGGDGLGGW